VAFLLAQVEGCKDISLTHLPRPPVPPSPPFLEIRLPLVLVCKATLSAKGSMWLLGFGGACFASAAVRFLQTALVTLSAEYVSLPGGTFCSAFTDMTIIARANMVATSSDSSVFSSISRATLSDGTLQLLRRARSALALNAQNAPVLWKEARKAARADKKRWVHQLLEQDHTPHKRNLWLTVHQQKKGFRHGVHA